LGHEVRHGGTAQGRLIWGALMPDRYVWSPEFDLDGRNFATHPLVDWQPDVVICADSDSLILDFCAGIARYIGAPVVVWGVDNHVRDYYRPDFDHYFFAHKAVNISRFEAKACTWLACATDPVAFPKSGIAWGARE